MVKRLAFVMISAFLFCTLFMICASAAEMIPAAATEYGAWSEWQTEPILPADRLEIESQVRTVDESVVSFTYNRFVYYNTLYDRWYAASTEQTGDFVRPDSGRWEEHETDEPLGVSGMDGDDAVYDGGWYNEEAVYTHFDHEQTMFRSRMVMPVTCEVSATEVLLFPGETRLVSVNFFDDVRSYFWTSTDASVATIDSNGGITAMGVGEARVWARSSQGREVSIKVLVCEREAKIPEGIYTLRLVGTTRTLATGGRLSTTRRGVQTQVYVGDRVQRFVVKRVDSLTFTLHPLNHRKWYVGAIHKGKKVSEGNKMQAAASRDRTAQNWRAIYVPDGSYILYPKSDEKLVLGADPTGGGSAVRMEAFGEMEQLDRWMFVKTNQSLGNTAPFVRPLARDGRSYVAAEFGEQQGEAGYGIEFESNERRVFVLSAARGKVTEVHDACSHDYVKTANAEGKFIDPCSLDLYSLGNYIVVDHGGGVTGTYGHLSEIYVEVGEVVRQGSMLGRSGATGSTGSVKLMFELWMNGLPVNPREYIKVPSLREPIS